MDGLPVSEASPSTSNTIFPSVRKEVLAFTKAAELLLSPALLSPGLTKDECDLIAEYVMNMSNSKTPWGKSLLIRYT